MYWRKAQPAIDERSFELSCEKNQCLHTGFQKKKSSNKWILLPLSPPLDSPPHFLHPPQLRGGRESEKTSQERQVKKDNSSFGTARLFKHHASKPLLSAQISTGPVQKSRAKFPILPHTAPFACETFRRAFRVFFRTTVAKK